MSTVTFVFVLVIMVLLLFGILIDVQLENIERIKESRRTIRKLQNKDEDEGMS